MIMSLKDLNYEYNDMQEIEACRYEKHNSREFIR